MKSSRKEYLVDALSAFLASLVMLLFVLINGNISIAMVIAFFSFPLCKFVAKKLYNKHE